MAAQKIAVIPGDGVGPEVMAEALPLLPWAKARGRALEWEILPFGADHFLRSGETLSEASFLALRDGFDGILFGAVGDPRIPDGRHAEEILLRLRRDLELRVNLRPCLPMIDALVPLRGIPADEIHIEVFRENTEGAYCLQGSSDAEEATDQALHSRKAITSLLRAAFQRAEARRAPLCLAHKANVLKHGHGLWMSIFRALQAEHPAVETATMHADAMLCALVKDPRPFGVIAADNLFGDLISDLLAAFIGGMGMAPSLAFAPHRPFRCHALAEPVHGSAPDIAGLGVANPTGMILSTAMLFRHLGWTEEADAVQASAARALETGSATKDIGGASSTSEMGIALRAGLP